MLKPAPGRAEGSSTLGWPSIWKGMPKFTPCSGMPSEAEADGDAGEGLDSFEKLAIEGCDLLRSR